MSSLPFRLLKADTHSLARAGIIQTPHGPIETPAFVPVGSHGTVRTLSPQDLRELGAPAILANTYHLYLRPGADLVQRLGGLHRFMAWPGPLLTDSGGFQVFSLGFGLEQGVGKIAPIFPGEDERRPSGRSGGGRLVHIDAEGVTFTSHLDGSQHRFTPELSIAVQAKLGADIIFALDECTSPLADLRYTQEALERTHRWAERCLALPRGSGQALFGIVQGGAFRELRERSAHFIASLPFEGYGIGGSLGRSKGEMHRVLEWTVPLLPSEKPRHLLGIGEPEDLLQGVARGIDLFDCAGPTRMARNGTVLTVAGRLNLESAALAEDPRPIQNDCPCYTCSRFSRAYLRHLFKAKELLGLRLASIHNLAFTLGLMKRMREAILQDAFGELKASFLARFRAEAESLFL